MSRVRCRFVGWDGRAHLPATARLALIDADGVEHHLIDKQPVLFDADADPAALHDGDDVYIDCIDRSGDGVTRTIVLGHSVESVDGRCTFTVPSRSLLDADGAGQS